MKRLLGALALAVTLLAVSPALAFADEFDDLCNGDPNCVVDDSSGSSGVPGFFVAFFILVVVIGVGTTIYRVSTARDLARRAGLDEDAAGAIALLDENGLSAAYVAASLRPRPDAPASDAPDAPRSEPAVRPAAERLAELQALRDSGAITESEHAARRQAIIDSI